MASSLLGRRVASHLDLSSSGRSRPCVRAVCGQRVRHGSTGSTAPLRARTELSSAAAAAWAPSRPPVGPTTVLCSSLHKERKKLAKVLKSHRKVLERRLSVLTAAGMDAPVMSELLTELRTLTSRLECQRATALLYAGDSSDSSDEDEECPARTAASIADGHAGSSGRGGLLQQPAAGEATGPAAPAARSHSLGGSIIISGLSGQLELPVPEPQEGWDWSEEEFRAAKFEGTAGRVMVCTGSKCQRQGATEVLRAVSALSDGNPAIEVVPCKCVGKCSAGAAIRVRPQGQPCATYTQVRPAQLRNVFQEHFAAEPTLETPSVACCDGCGRS